MSTATDATQDNASAPESRWEAAKKALDPFFDQLNAADIVVQDIAESLAEEGIDSYAGPLRAASRNLEEAFHDLAHDLKRRLQNGEEVEA